MASGHGVFKGGGVKGIGHIGALAAAEAAGWTWQAVAGTSAGAITAALVAAGFSATELKPILFDLDFEQFKDGHLAIIRLLRKEGMYKGEFFEQWLENLLLQKTGKPYASFRDLEELTGIGLRVVATDLTNARELVFPDDLADYGFADPQGFPVSRAVRASMSIPFFFEPFELACPGNKTATLVDGGVLSNFPVSLFNPGGAPAQIPTFGFNLQAADDKPTQPTDSLEEFAHALINTLFEAHDNNAVVDQNFERTINIPTGSIGTTDFKLTQEQKDWLYASGLQAATAFLADPSVQTWLSTFPAVLAETEAAPTKQ